MQDLRDLYEARSADELLSSVGPDKVAIADLVMPSRLEEAASLALSRDRQRLRDFAEGESTYVPLFHNDAQPSSRAAHIRG